MIAEADAQLGGRCRQLTFVFRHATCYVVYHVHYAFASQRIISICHVFDVFHLRFMLHFIAATLRMPIIQEHYRLSLSKVRALFAIESRHAAF